MKYSAPIYLPYKPSWIARTLGKLNPEWGMKRVAREMRYHEFAYDAARMSTRRNSAPQNINPNSFDVQRDRLQLMREAFDLEKNFSPAKALNMKYSMFTSPQTYHPSTGDTGLDRAVSEWWDAWAGGDDTTGTCDISEQFNFYRMMDFGTRGMNVGGDYGFAFIRPGLPDDIDLSDDEALEYAMTLPLCIQAVEPDRIGGVYQNVVSEHYVSGILIGEWGQPTHYRIFRRSPIVSQYTDPVDVPKDQFVHFKDPMRIDQLRPPGKLDTAISLLRDMYETLEYMRMKQKLASALTVFTNSLGANQGAGAMDAYQTNLFANNQSALQQDIKFGQINHLVQGMDIKFPDTETPGSESQFLIVFTMKLVAMSYNLPYSFALDAAELGGVSTRLESEMAKAEFDRGKAINAHTANKIKNTALLDACAKGFLPADRYNDVIKGRWGFRPHPQPDIGKEASASVSLFQNGLLNPKSYWAESQKDPEQVANDFVDWALIKSAALKRGQTVDPTLTGDGVFGKGPTLPGAGDKGGDDKGQPAMPGQPPQGPAPHQFEYRDSEERDSSGKWTSGGGSAATSHLKPTIKTESGLKTHEGKELPDHIKSLGIPPAWSNVRISHDPKSSVLAHGYDAKGRAQSIYSDDHNSAQAAAKFQRIKELAGKINDIRAKNEQLRSDPKAKENADALKLIESTGLRPGSDTDTGAEKDAYGATTLLGKHVTKDENGTTVLDFVGKKGVDLKIPIHDPNVAQMVQDRAAKSGAEGKLFNTDDSKLRDHVKRIAGDYKVKDFRTLKGTSTAHDLIKSMPVPSNSKEYVKAVKQVATQVSQKLGNTPAMALSAYIDPDVFSSWAHAKPEAKK